VDRKSVIPYKSAYTDFTDSCGQGIVAGGGEKGKKPKDASCCPPGAFGNCRVDSLVPVDDRGQMILPKELREKAGIRGGDKLAVISWEKEGRVCCLSLIKVEEFSGMIKGVLGPLMGDLLPKT
jgi:AbrB family looped-hinge helix DNA binding protein